MMQQGDMRSNEFCKNIGEGDKYKTLQTRGVDGIIFDCVGYSILRKNLRKIF